jgi:hypothetical protein
MKTRLPTYKNKIIRDSCHCIFNAFNNKYQRLVGERKRDRTKSNQQLSTTVKSTEKQTKNNHQSVRSDHIYDDIQLELSASLEQLCLSQNEPHDIYDLVQDDERDEDQTLTVVKELAAGNQCDDVSDPHCSISNPKDNIQQTQKPTKN